VYFLLPQVNYKFRVRALNIYGWGEFSTEATFFTSDVPLGSSGITMQIVNMNVEVSWTLPFSNYDPIDSYRIKVLDSTGNQYHLIETYCNGNLPVIVTERTCNIPMVALANSPLNLPVNQEIVVQVTAHNARGWGVEALSTNGLLVQTVP
jgi:hypothetical protein